MGVPGGGCERETRKDRGTRRRPRVQLIFVWMLTPRLPEQDGKVAGDRHLFYKLLK